MGSNPTFSAKKACDRNGCRLFVYVKNAFVFYKENIVKEVTAEDVTNIMRAEEMPQWMWF